MTLPTITLYTSLVSIDFTKSFSETRFSFQLKHHFKELSNGDFLITSSSHPETVK